MTRISPWHATLWVVAAFVLAQISGALVSGVLQTLARSAGVPVGSLDAWVVLPSMLAVGGSLLACALLAPRVAGVPTRRACGLDRAPPLAYAATALGTLMLGPLADLLMRTMQRLWPGATWGTVGALHELAAAYPTWLLWPVLALLPGLAEELLFRGILLRSFRVPALGVVVSGLAFAAFHADPHHVAGVLPLGLFLSWAAARSSTRVSIVAHVVNNTLALVTTRIEDLDVGYGTERPMPDEWLPASLLIFAACVAVILRVRRPPTA